MKSKLLLAGLVALGFSASTVSAYMVSGVVSCPNGTSSAGIVVYVSQDLQTFPGVAFTDANGAYVIEMPTLEPGTYRVCIDPYTLPMGVTSATGCAMVTFDANNQCAEVNITLEGPFCCEPPPPCEGRCWLTGGGTIGKTKGVANFSYGGVVNPGCSPTAAGGGNWNVIDHLNKLHFKGLFISVITCSGVPTKSPKVNVNIIDFEGVGIIEGISGNPMPLQVVNFHGRAIDNAEPGGGKDRLYLNVFESDPGDPLLLISGAINTPEVIEPVAISTGNLQIHTTGCNK